MTALNPLPSSSSSECGDHGGRVPIAGSYGSGKGDGKPERVSAPSLQPWAGLGTGPSWSLEPEVTNTNSPSRKTIEVHLKNSWSNGDRRSAKTRSSECWFLTEIILKGW